MSKSNEQWLFLLDVASLINFAQSRGYKLTGGELHRSPEQQSRYVKVGLSKTMDSMHLQRMAIDFNIFYDVNDDGQQDYIDTEDEYEDIGTELGDYWSSLSPKNQSGFDWGWDFGHFERRP